MDVLFSAAKSAPPKGFIELDRVPDYINVAVPYFFAAIFVEYVYTRIKFDKQVKERAYRLNDAINSMTLGVLETARQLFTIFLKSGPYLFLYTNYRVATLPVNMWTWLLMFVGVELGYYWFHRYSHEMNLLWAAHQVHHSSENYNLATALRQSFMQHLFHWPFFVPFAVLGFAPALYIPHAYINTLYQFWIHSRAIPKFPKAIEYIFNTPSHHRVHHGRNPYCIDTNYGGTLIIFDRLFGTFAQERTEDMSNAEEVRYGLVDKVSTWEPIYHNMFKFWGILKACWTYKSLKPIYKSPAYNPEGPDWDIPETGKDEPSVRYDEDAPGHISAYIVIHFAAMIVYATVMLREGATMCMCERVIHFSLLCYTGLVFGKLFDRSRYAMLLEVNRLGLLSIISDRIIPYFLNTKEPSQEALYAVYAFYALSVVYAIRAAVSWPQYVRSDKEKNE